MSHSFPLAPMSPVIKGLTITLWILPLMLGLWAILSRQPVVIILFVAILLLFGSVWFGCRPSHFVVVQDALNIVFPLWQRRIPIRDITDVRILSSDTFRHEFGWAIRIGVGGLWGGFGWLLTRKGLLEFYCSRLDTFVFLERATEASLLITPTDPDQFINALQNARH